MVADPITAELKAQWLAALRSGKYQQGHGCLCRNNKYCCLGVLAKLAGRLDEDGYFDGKCRILLRDDETIYLLPARTQDILSDRNDTGASFAKIADWIEANVEAA